jgi:hypothetical protein
VEEKTKALPPQSESDGLEEFSQLWERSSELRDILSRLPGQVVLKSGLSSKRNSLIERWDKLESPSIDGTLSPEALPALEKWIYEAEISISYIIQIRKQEKSEALGRIFGGRASELEFEIVEQLSEVEFVSNNWCFPWPEPKVTKKKSASRDKLFKMGGIAALGAIAVVTYLDED